MNAPDAPFAVVVEDEMLIRFDAAGILAEAGFRTLDAQTADEAIPLIVENETEVGLLFTDVDMPGSMNGFALARHVAEMWPGIGILVVSGRVEPGPGELPEGAVFISKPFSPQTIHDRINALLPRGQRPRTIEALHP